MTEELEQHARAFVEYIRATHRLERGPEAMRAFLARVDTRQVLEWARANEALDRVWRRVCVAYHPSLYRGALAALLRTLWSTNLFSVVPCKSGRDRRGRRRRRRQQQRQYCAVLGEPHRACFALTFAGVPSCPDDPRSSSSSSTVPPLRARMPELKSLRVCAGVALFALSFDQVRSFPVRVQSLVTYEDQGASPAHVKRQKRECVLKGYARSVRLLLRFIEEESGGDAEAL